MSGKFQSMPAEQIGKGSRAIKAALEEHPDWTLEKVGELCRVSASRVHVVRSQLRDGTWKDPADLLPKKDKILGALAASPGRSVEEVAAELGVTASYVKALRSEAGLGPPRPSPLRPKIAKALEKKPWTSPEEIARQTGASVHTVRHVVRELQRSGEFQKMVAKASGTQIKTDAVVTYRPQVVIEAPPVVPGGSPLDAELLNRATQLQAWYGSALGRIADMFECPERGRCGQCPACLARQALEGAPEEFNHVELAGIELRRRHADYESRIKKELAEKFVELLDSPKILPGLLMMRMERAAVGRVRGGAHRGGGQLLEIAAGE